MSVLDAQPASALPIDSPATRLREVLDGQRSAFLAEGPPPLATRLERIDRLVAGVLESADELVEALAADFGSRPRLTSLAADVVGILPSVSSIRANLHAWMREDEVVGSAEAGTPAFVQKRPKGVVGVIGPWNFPVSLVLAPAVDALAAGNRVMIKVSEIPARTADVVARAVARHLPPDVVTVVRGGAETAAAFSALPFDHLIFTGSPAVGARVAEVAGRNLVPVTLELGGKNPVVLGPDADVATAAARVAAARLLNGGQLCLCPDQVFVPRESLTEFVTHVEAAVRGMFPTVVGHPGFTSVIDERNFDRVIALVADAETKGADVRRIAPPAELSLLPDRASRRMAPTLLLGTTPDMAVASEEIFGPVLAIDAYNDLDELIAVLQAQPSPLAAYWFGADGPEFRRFLDRTTSGGVTRNDLLLHWVVDGAPSGGVGRSGMGAYSGEVGFRTFSHLRTVAANSGPEGTAAPLLPPAGEAEADALREYAHQALAEIRSRIPVTG